ncbi:MAG: hypothetical protein K0Q55_1348 [Verrucomicrobia bacterium]|nr:hypothetical protein [Verrucomicrobiota bacterium]
MLWLGLVLSARAQDTISYFSGPSFSFPADGDFASIDFDRDGTADFSFSGGLFLCTMDIPTSACSTSFNGVPMGTNSFMCNGSSLTVVPAGTTISDTTVSNATWKNFSSATLATYQFSPKYGTSAWGGPLNAAREGYFGVRFSTSAGVHYGWVHARMPEPGTNTFSFSPVILDWAYETRPDTVIVAGAMPVAAVTAPQIVRPERLRLNWRSQVGKSYQIQFKERLDAPGWTNLDINVVATGTNSIVDISIKSTMGFYQAVRAD